MNRWLLIFVFLCTIVVVSCKKLTGERVAAIVTNDITIQGTTIKAAGTIVDLGETGITDHGFCWADSATVSVSSNKTSLQTALQTGAFEQVLLNLVPGKEYFVKAYATVGNETIYGNAQRFLAPDSGFIITTGQLQIVSASLVNIQGSVKNVGSLVLQSYGVCWSRTIEPTIAGNKIDFGMAQHDTIFIADIKPLALKTAYFTRVYAKLNDNTTLYGNTVTFTIPDLEVATDTFSFAPLNTATLKGKINNLGIPAVTDHGFCWATTTSNPNFNNNKISLGIASTTGLFFANISALTAGKTYYFRAYATDGNTVRYGKIIHFTF